MKRIKGSFNKLVTWVKKNYYKAALMMYTMCYPVTTALADEGDLAKAQWDKVINFILPWIQRLGGVVILIGAVEFGLAWKNDDAEAKTKGMRTIIAGCIVLAVGVSSSTFLV